MSRENTFPGKRAVCPRVLSEPPAGEERTEEVARIGVMKKTDIRLLE
jgi:hypothetical protein